MDLTIENRALKEYKSFVSDISFDYHCENILCRASLGLCAIRVLSKGKLSEKEFEKTWRLWRERVGFGVGYKEVCHGEET